MGDFSENSIDEASDRCPCAFDSFVNGGVVWEAENDELTNAHAQDVADFVVEFSFAEFADNGVE